MAIVPGTRGDYADHQKDAVRFGALEANMPAAATAAAGAATLNQAQGIVTTESLATAAGGTYTLTLTNSAVGAADMVFVTLWNGTNTGGSPSDTTVKPAAGSVVIVVQNIHATTAFNGTLKIGFMVVKAAPAAL